MIRDRSTEDELGIATDQLAFIVLKARAFDAEVDATMPDEGSNDVDDNFVETLESGPDNETARELRAAINSLNDEAQAALVALVWVGRGDFEPSEWSDAVKTASERRKSAGTARYLMG